MFSFYYIINSFNLKFKIINIYFLPFSATLYQKCPPHSQHFEKILGFRPDTQQYTHVLHRQTIQNSTNAINYNCWQLCQRDIECSSYVLFFLTFECFGFSQNPKSLTYQYLPEQIDLVADPNSVYFEKTCIKSKTKNKFTKTTKHSKVIEYIN